jgi:phage terminase small subunit
MSSKDINKIDSTNIVDTKDNSANNIKIIGTPLKDNLKELFCIYYSRSLNKIDSYIKARKEIGMNEVQYFSAATLVQRIFIEEEVQTRIQELIDHTANNIQISKARILEGIQEEINLDPAEVFTWKGNALVLKSLNDIPLNIRKTIKGLKQTKDGIEVTFCDRQRAREQLMKYVGMLSDRLDINVTHDIGKELAAAHQRVMNRPGAIENAEFEEIGPE